MSNLGPHEIRLRPAPHCRTPILSYSLKVEPEPHFLNWQQDPYGNWVARLVFPERADKLVIEVDLVADLTVINPFDFFVEPYAEKYPFTYAPALAKELIPFLETAPLGPRLEAWLADFRRTILPDENPVLLLVRLNQLLQRQIRYLVRMEPGVQTPELTLENCSGSCRDTGWLLVQIMRHLGIAARFASGYLIQLVADVKALDGPSGTDHDFTDLHAWAEAFIPGAGWIGLDPTSGLLAGEGHIPLACTADPGNAAPVIGYTDVASVEFDFAMSVTRVHEDPRVTRAVQRRPVAGDRRARRTGRPRPGVARRAADAGRRADVRVDRRHGGARVELHGAVAEKARAGRDTSEAAAGALRARRLPAFRPGQVVSGRTAATLGAGRVLARRRAAAVAASRADRRHDQAAVREPSRRRSSSASAWPPRSGCPRRC